MTTQSIFKSEAGRETVMALYDRALATWTVPFTTQTVATRHGATYVISAGQVDGPPLILLHGAGSNSAIWGPDIAAYAPHYRVHAVDLIGEPGRSAPNRPPWEGPAFAEWLEDVLDGLGVEQAILVGISQGGWTALKFAVAQPGRVTALALLTPGGIVPDKTSFLVKVIPLSLLGSWGVARITRMLFGSQPVPEEAIEITQTVTTNFKPRIGMLPVFTEEELARLQMPIVLVMGDEDAMRDGAKISARLTQCTPQTETRVLPGAGHVLLNTYREVVPFLAAVVRV